MSLLKTVRNRTRTQYAAGRIADRFAPSQPTHAATVAGKNLVTIDGRTVPASGIDAADVGLPVAVVNSGSAGIAAYSANGAGIAVQFAGGGGTGSGGGMEVHDLNSVWHTGTLADSQAPQFLKLDGSRQLTGNLSVAASVTIDGIDISAHAADPDAHHARATAGSGIAIVGQQVAISPSAAGDGLAWNAGAFNVGAGNGLTVSADAIALTTPGTLTAATSNSAAGSHTHAVTTTTAGTPSTILALDASSYTQAARWIATDRVRTPMIDTAAGNLTIIPAGDLILDPGESNVLPGGSIQDDLGDYNRKWRTLYAAELYVETLVAQDVLSTIGGRIMVAPTTTLIADVAAGDAVIDVKHNNLTLNGYVMLQTAPGGIAQFEAMRIVGAATPIAGGYRYGVERNKDGSGANAWVSGDAVANLGGDAGEGYIDITSTQTIHNHLGPTITIYSRLGAANWNDARPVVSFGNLRSFADYSSNEFGIAIANDLTLQPDTGLKGLTADRTNGVRMFSTAIQLYNGSTQTVQISPTGADIWIGPSSADKRLSWNGSTLTVNGAINVTGGNAATQTYANSAASTAQSNAQTYTDTNAANLGLTNVTRALVSETLITGGNIRVGSGTKDSNLYGFHIDSGEIVGQNGTGIDEVVLGTDGKIKAGQGNVWMDYAGLGFNAATGKFTAATASWWYGGQRYLAIGTQADLGTPTGAFIETYSATPLAMTANGGITLAASNNVLSFNGNTIWHAGNDGATSGLYAQYAATATSASNADNLGGYTSTAYARTAAANTFTANQQIDASLGIGIAPTRPLQVHGAYGNPATTGTTPNGVVAISVGNTYSTLYIGSASTSPYAMWMQAQGRNALGTNYALALNPNGGNVGIGAINPGYTLEVNGSLYASGAVGGSWASLSLRSGVANYGSYAASKCKKFGDLVLIVLSFAPNTVFPSTWFATVPAGYEPGAKIMLTATALGKTVPAHVSIGTDGHVNLENQGALGTDPTAILFTGIYSTGVS